MKKVSVGQTVYDEEGDEIGTVRGLDEDGFFVTTREGIECLSVEHERSGHEIGEAELIWRCSECGTVGDIDEMPDECPNCGVDKTYLYYWTED
ncbi:rubredoxin-like domain-containing protein [Halorutilales archaeon Cl-col2-1]